MATKITTTIDLADLPPVVDMYPTAAAVLGIGRSTAYELTRRGEFPVPVLKVGSATAWSPRTCARCSDCPHERRGPYPEGHDPRCR